MIRDYGVPIRVSREFSELIKQIQKINGNCSQTKATEIIAFSFTSRVPSSVDTQLPIFKLKDEKRFKL